jgi:hypothetical protein
MSAAEGGNVKVLPLPSKVYSALPPTKAYVSRPTGCRSQALSLHFLGIIKRGNRPAEPKDYHEFTDSEYKCPYFW